MLVNCVAYQEGKKLADITVQDIRRHVSRRSRDAVPPQMGPYHRSRSLSEKLG